MSGETPLVIDKQVLELLQDAIGESLLHIIQLYITEVPVNIKEMREALASGDLATVRRLAHSLKASSANLGAMQTSTFAADLEHQIDAGESEAAKISAGINLIAKSFDQASTILEGIQLN